MECADDTGEVNAGQCCAKTIARLAKQNALADSYPGLYKLRLLALIFILRCGPEPAMTYS